MDLMLLAATEDAYASEFRLGVGELVAAGPVVREAPELFALLLCSNVFDLTNEEGNEDTGKIADWSIEFLGEGTGKLPFENEPNLVPGVDNTGGYWPNWSIEGNGVLLFEV